MKTNHRQLTRRILARVMLTVWIGSQVAQPVFAAATDIADVPMAVLNNAKPNIMFILDNSGSMEWRSITGVDALSESNDNQTEFYSSAYNGLWYDPNTLYVSGIDKNSFTATNIQGAPIGNSTANAAPNNPYLPGKGTTNLEGYCYYSGTTAPLKPNTATGGNCKTSSTSAGGFTNGPIGINAFFYDYTGPVGGSLTNDANYTRRNIISTINSYTRASTRTDCTVSGSTANCNYGQEIQNFANWWTYYRTRILTMKTTMGLAFASLNDKYRMGFSTINNSGGTGNGNGENFISISDFNYTNKSAWYTKLYAIDPNNGTPLQRALTRVGQYYSGNGMGYSGGITAPGTDDPVQYSCQHNYAILSTDGFWNSNDVTLGNKDTTVPTLPAALPTGTTPALTAGSAFPKPFYDANSTSNTLSDVAMYYWATDLRTSGSLATNNVSTNSADPASWQHMTTFTIGLGADGTKDFRDDYLTATTNNWFYNNLINGSDNWPAPAQDTATAIDDLWHAAVNGRGQYFNAKNPVSLRTSLKKVLDDIIARSGSAAAVAVANTDVSLDNTAYASSYNSGNWGGDLASFIINPATGIVATTPTWTAQSQLNSQTASSRQIVTYSGSSGIQFQPTSATTTTKLTTTQQNALNSTTTPPGPSDGANVLAYIRGDRTLEGTDYRTRMNLLGDIVNAEPVVVTTPVFEYGDAGYAAFKAAQSVTATTSPPFTPTRIKSVFQPSNDGMVHAFRASDGAENWAYIPSFFLSSSAPSRLVQLTQKDNFAHRYFVDATPVVGDVDFNKTVGITWPVPPAPYTSDWRTLLVGGLGKGGRGYYALDVTTPTAPDEATAATKVAWEFPVASTGGTVSVTRPAGSTTTGAFTMNTNKIGYTYGRPVIVKTKAHGWVALVTSGYNNGTDTGGAGTDGTGGDGHGYLFVLNARTGALLHVFDTEAGNATTPSGLAHISAYVENPLLDNTVQYVYGGDLLGNVWRFDLSTAPVVASTTNPQPQASEIATAVSSWRLQKLAALVDSSGVAQQVSTEPELASIRIGNADMRFVYVGTGQYLGSKDVPGVVGANASATQTQTMYGLVDDLSTSTTNPVIYPLRSNLKQQLFTTSGTTRTTSTLTSDNVVYSGTGAQKGWYIDLPVSGERINTNPALTLGVLYFTSNIPNSDPCNPGGSSWLNALDYQNGQQTSLGWGSTFLGNALASRPIPIQKSNGEVQILVRMSDASTVSTAGKLQGFTPTLKRSTWRQSIKY
jgi:type IV pilus assembly protein PilY1